MNDLTVIISANNIDSHPEINYIQEVIESLCLTGIDYNTRIILSHDRINPSKENYNDCEVKYQQYFINLKNYCSALDFKNIDIIQSKEWGHLTRSLKNAVSKVDTEYMLIMQHDIHIRRAIPTYNLIDLMKKYPHIKHLRFNVRKNLPTFMGWDGWKKDGEFVFKEQEYDGIKVCLTPAWSDQNHLTTKEYYNNIIFPDCTTDGEIMYDFMENKLNYLCHFNHERYGTYIYDAYNAPRTSRHSDGRNINSEKDED